MLDKKIIIVNNNLDIGGVQCSLINLLEGIKNDYDITLFLFSNTGEYINNVPKNIKVIEASKKLQLLGISQLDAKKNGIKWNLLRGVLATFTKLFGNKIPFKFLMRSENILDDYDYAISYLHSSNEKSFYAGCNEFVLNSIQAKEKLTFIHCDFLSYGGNTIYNRELYKKFDKVALVSNGCKEKFSRAIPEMENKLYCVRNFNNYKDIIAKSNINSLEYDKDYFNIITVARLSEEKGLMRCIPIIKNLLEEGYKIKWIIVGDGSLRDSIENYIRDNHLENNILLCGNKRNPYRYIKNSDLFLLPSYHEAAPMVFDESKCLGVPILATRTTSTYEMIEECNAGWVCENSKSGIREKLLYILNNRNELMSIKNELMKKRFSNESSLIQFKKLLGEV